MHAPSVIFRLFLFALDARWATEQTVRGNFFAMTKWYRKAFGADYAKRYAHRDEREARRTLELFHQTTDLQPPARLLDLACGSGRHAGMLAQRGFCVAGLDLSAELLTLARQVETNEGEAPGARSEATPVDYVLGEMNALPFADEVFDGALNLFTSFGYYRDDERNAAVIAEVARTLKQGGAFFFDFLNRPQVEGELIQRSERLLADGAFLEETRRIDRATGRVEKNSLLRLPDGSVQERFESVRLFSREQLAVCFDDCGLQIVKTFGDYDGGAWASQAPRLILVAVKT